MPGICIKHWQKCMKNRSKKVFPLVRKSPSTDGNTLKNTFPLGGKIELAVAGVYQKGRKK